MRISITFGPAFDLSTAVRRGIENAVLTPSEAETAVWLGDRLTYRTERPPEEMLADWEAHGYARDDFLSVETGPWVERQDNPTWSGRKGRIHRQ